MALIKKKVDDIKEKVKLEISSKIIDEIHEYMKWSDISDINYFIEESILFLFNSDKNWKKHKKYISNNTKNNDG